MSTVPLSLGPLAAPGYVVHRSGLRWLCDDGYVCRPGEVIAYCSIGLKPDGSDASGPRPFAQEARDFQVALAPRVGGRVSKSGFTSLGGYLDQLMDFQPWIPEFVVGHVQCRPSQRPPDFYVDGGLRLLFLAGRRVTEIAEVRSGLLTGWHDRSRGWWGDAAGASGTLLSLGICDQAGTIRGERFAFLEMFEAARGPAQVVYCPDDALVHCAPVLTDQLLRTPAQIEAIVTDFATTFSTGAITPAPGDWIFAGSLLSALQRSPVADRYEILTRSGLRHTGPPEALFLSLNAESPYIFRHRKLGYALYFHEFRLKDLGPAVVRWLRESFERVERSPADIQRDYRVLIDTVRARADTKILIQNVMSTVGNETIHHYASYDRPMGATLSCVHTKDLNLMLHDLARERDIDIVDFDAIAAELGGMIHLPDGVHPSGAMQAEARSEVLRILHARGVPGFGPLSST